jgi:hypothetical protein
MNTPTPETDANQVDAIKLYTSLNARIQCHLNFDRKLEFHRQQMVGLRREIEHQKARVAAWEKVASPYPPNAADQAQPR